MTNHPNRNKTATLDGSLQGLLDEHNASAVGSGEIAPGIRLTRYIANGRIFLVQEFIDEAKHGTGWDIFIPAHDGNSIGATLNNTAHYLMG